MTRSVIAIVVGFVLIAALSFGADALMSMAYPSLMKDRIENLPILCASLVYVGVFAVFGCYVTARLAPDRPMGHALVLGALGLLFSLAMMPQAWNTVPAWYNILSLLLVMPYAWIGGRIRESQLARGGQTTAMA